ncbi:MAG: hypothetical protein H6736_19885 [Alphaproteobacteria bacterium]|nr:hypothetical protein [Alphaproteobacteria bacterium]MCB9694075.1 hypothetical protein [Alphaproteobacteria bacterium]
MLSEVLFEVVNLAVLAAGLWWLLFRPVTRALADEVREREQAASTLAADRTELDAGQADLTARRSALDAEIASGSHAILDAAHAQAREIVEAAHAEVQASREAWDDEQRRRMESAGTEAAARVAEVTAEAVRELLTRASGPDLDLALVRATLGELPETVEGPVWVELAREPGPEVRAALEARLPAGFEVRVRRDLAAGVRIGTPAGLVDGSASGMAHAAAEQLGSRVG